MGNIIFKEHGGHGRKNQQEIKQIQQQSTIFNCMYKADLSALN